MAIKDAIVSGIAINDALVPSAARELCNDDINNDDAVSNSKHAN